MTMAIDSRPAHHLGGMGYDPMQRYQPQFSNPWSGSSSASPPNQMYNSLPQHSSTIDHSQTSRAPIMSMGYVANPAASSLGSDLVPSRSYGSPYAASTAPSQQTSAYAPTSAPRYSPEHQAVSPYDYESEVQRRRSYGPSSSRATFHDEMASARGMVAMATTSHDMTPRPIYGNSSAREGSHDSYGFPAPPHSAHSSVSSASTYPYYSGSYAGSVDGSSVTDYSEASDDMGPRTLPAPNQLISGFPPEPQSMMNQFNSKLSPSAQKKHKCKICDKRFTRPSSLQTHMYSHTGEKPFACDHDGCGRHFSVVSNLRRHKKVHKDDLHEDVDED